MEKRKVTFTNLPHSALCIYNLIYTLVLNYCQSCAKKIKCSFIKMRMLCGQDNEVDKKYSIKHICN